MFKLLIMFFSISALADSVALEDGRKFSDCTYSQNSGEMFCEENDKNILVKYSLDGEPFAIEYSKKSKLLKVHRIEYLKGKDSDFLYYADPRIPSTLTTENPSFDGVMATTNISSKAVLSFSESLKYHSEFNSEVDDILDIARKKEEDLNAKISKGNLKINVDGNEISCERESVKSCNIQTCKDSKGGDIYYLSLSNQIYSSFLVIPDPRNKLTSKYPTTSKISSADGEVLISRKNDDSFNYLSKTAPGKYKNNPDLFYSGIDPYFASLHADAIHCKNLPPQLLRDVENNIKNDQKNADMVELVDSINGVIENVFVNIDSLPEIVCSYNGVYYNPEAFKKISKKFSKGSSAVSEKKAMELFSKAKNREDIAWNYTYDGCYARAHLMARMFEEEGVFVEKAWARGQLEIPGSPGLTWGYHVAPSVDVIGADGVVKKMIIDPSIADKPITKEEWLSKMKVDKKNVKDTSYPATSNSNVYNKISFSYSNTDAYWPFFNEISEDQKILHATQVMEEYLNY